MVAQRRLELLRPFGHRHLKTARLPITSLSPIFDILYAFHYNILYMKELIC